MVLYLEQLKVQCLVFLILPNSEKRLVVNKVYDLMYLSGLFTESLKVPRLDVLKALYNIINLLFMKEVQRDTRRII